MCEASIKEVLPEVLHSNEFMAFAQKGMVGKHNEKRQRMSNANSCHASNVMHRMPTVVMLATKACLEDTILQST
jgi:hypothetical protein